MLSYITRMLGTLCQESEAETNIYFILQTHLRDIAGPVPDHCNKMNTATKKSHKFFGFPVFLKVMFILYYRCMGVQQHYV